MNVGFSFLVIFYLFPLNINGNIKDSKWSETGLSLKCFQFTKKREDFSDCNPS